ncbi:acyl-coenzyme a thioesterase 12 [Limosa lapponica baueri]|uniref:Acyl-coenzyme a thioesterase 12 n=1 Tax=Limosa lapponica baueri TaxID=1758121 RepID=A0A2I0TMA2_LIMLA|nr:acyl-coenzyme a thioesterase 12 [Limosa lapponica baueri]
MRRYHGAIARRRIRLARKCMLATKEDKPSDSWERSNQIKIWTHEEGDVLSFKVEMKVKIPSNLAFSLLSDFKFRQQWDKHFFEPYVVAVKSVTLASMPPSPEYCRSEILCAGFQIYSVSHSSCTVCYFNQVTSGVMPYLAANLTGSSKSIEDTALECIKFLELECSKCAS